MATAHWELSGAIYPFSKLREAPVLAQVSQMLTGAAELKLHDENQRDLVEMEIARAWMDQWFEPAPLPQIHDASTGEPILLVTDHYRVHDAAALAAALVAQADVSGDPQLGWNRMTKGSDGVQRSLSSINPRREADRIEVFHRTGAHSEVEAIVDHMARECPAPIADFVQFKFFTGMRPSEVAALRWSDVDLATQSVHVHRAIVQGQEKATTKTNTARMVLLNSRSLGALMRQRSLTQLAGDFVFVDSRYGTPWLDERAFRRSYWTPTLTALGLRYRKPYNTRHRYATMMLMAGMTPAFCAAQLGHSVGMLLGTYAKWLDGAHNTLEMQRLEAALERDSSPNLSQKQPRRTSAGTRATRGYKPLARVK